MARRPNPLNPSSSPLALFGSELRIHREHAGLSQEQLGTKANYTGSFVGAVERAEEMPRREFPVAMDRVLGLTAATADGSLTRLWDGLLKSSAYPPWFDWPIHESGAIALRTFELALVPGLLQNEAYARALLSGDEAAVAARMARQAILTREKPEPPLLICVLDESVPHREVGNPEIMRDQLEQLITTASPRIAVHVVPSRGHDGVNGSFVLATLEDRSEVAYVDTGARGITTGDPKDLKTLTERFESIRSLALPVDQSLDLIARTAKDKWT